MELIEIKNKVENYYAIDMSDRNNGKRHSDARKLYVFMARNLKYNGRKDKIVYQDIGDLIGRKHETCIYHNKVANQWFDAGDHEFRRDLFAVFGVMEKDDKEILRLDRLRLVYDDLLLSIPEGMHDEIMETIHLKIESRKWKSNTDL